MGLTVMAILARCCAGDLKHTITDQDPSYFAMLKHLQYLSGEDEQGTGQLDPANQAVFRRWLDTLAGGLSQAQDETRGTLVSITLDVINVGNLPVNSLLELRTDKTQFAASLRRNYAEAIEEYVSQLTVPGLKPSDARALQEEFRSKMKLDMDRLFAELRLTGLKTLLSREVAIALAAPIAGATVFAASGLGSVLGGTLGMAALAKLGVEYRASRNAVFERHPMAFLYAQKGVRLY
jgi:hypothetical protein